VSFLSRGGLGFILAGIIALTVLLRAKHLFEELASILGFLPDVTLLLLLLHMMSMIVVVVRMRTLTGARRAFITGRRLLTWIFLL
jgi:hypothetical protein